MSLDARRGGEALRAASGDLLRAWRAGRPPEDGLSPVDGLMGEFLERVAEALLLDTPPEAVWPQTGGVVRLSAGPEAAARAAQDFRLAGAVLHSAALALQLAADVATRVQRTVEEALRALPAGTEGWPAQVLVVRLLPRAQAAVRSA